MNGDAKAGLDPNSKLGNSEDPGTLSQVLVARGGNGVLGAFVFLVGCFAVALYLPHAEEPAHAAPATAAVVSSAEALELCQSALRGFSAREYASVTAVPNRSLFGDYYFVWDAASKFVEIPRDSSNVISTRAACKVSRASPKITALTLDGVELVK